MKSLTKVNLLDYVTGASILGCGGGGSAESGIAWINEAFERDYKFKLADINEVDDDKLLCIMAGVGGGVPKEVKDKVEPYTKMFSQTPEVRYKRLSKSAEELSGYVGKEIYSYIASETGGGNGVLPMFLNAMEGKPSIDGDCCGRAKPEMGLSLTNVAGIPVTPLAMVTPFMETVILKNSVDDYRAEDITRNVAVASGGNVTVARCLAPIKLYKKGIAHNLVSKCISIGEAIRKAKKKGDTPKKVFVEASGAVELFAGNVKEFTMEGKGGFNWGNWNVKGTGKHNGHNMRIWFKNENLIAWIDDKPKITCPDLICVIDNKTFNGLSNFVPDATHKGKDITVYGVKAVEEWRTPKGIEIFGPKHFGFDFDYIPF
jgi:hypothetical protein